MTLQVGFSYALFFIAVISISLLYYNLTDAVEGVPCLAVE